MNLNEFFEELGYPLRSPTTLVALVSFFLLLRLAAFAGLFGIWLAVMVVPAFFRYLVMLAEARARGADADPPGIEYFSLIGNLWTLFPVLPALLFVQGLRETLSWGAGWATLFAAAMALVTPAMMAVLVITHSPLQSLNPAALMQLVRRVGPTYLFAPPLLAGIVWIPTQLAGLSAWIQTLIELYLAFAFYAVVGAMIRGDNLIEEVDVPDALEPEPEQQIADLQKQRTAVLNHAYGFASRGNRAGALHHVDAWIRTDPDPDAAWSWFFDQMLRWEQPDHALYFAQRYIGELLARGDKIGAVKVILRGRLVNERFRPASEDLPQAIEAARACGNAELADALQRL